MLPVAKRTRMGVDKILNDRCLKERGNRAKKSTGAPVPEYGGVSSVEWVNVDWEDDDEEFSEVKKGESPKSRKCEKKVKKGGSSKSRKCERKGERGEKMKKDWHASDDDDDDDVVLMVDSTSDGDGDVVLMVDSTSDGDDDLSEEEVDSDVMVVSVIDKGEENEDEDERVVVDDDVVDDDVKEEVVVVEFSDSSSSEGENFYNEESDDTYNEDERSDDDDDESSSYVKSEDEGETDSSDGDAVDCRIWERNDGKCKNGRTEPKGRVVCSVGRKSEERIVKSGLKKRTELRDYEVKCGIWERNDVKCKGKGGIAVAGQGGTKNGKRNHEHVEYRVNGKSKPEAEVVEMLPSSDDEIHGISVEKNGRVRRKQVAKKRKVGDNLDGLRILADSLHGEGEALKKFEKEKPKYKFWFKDGDKKPVEKSDFDKLLAHLFKEMDMVLTFEQTGSTPLEVDNGDHCETQTNTATLCSQGIHHLVLDEQIGIICKYCSHVKEEIKHILPTFSKPSSQTRRRAYFEQAGCPVYLGDFRYTGAGRHDYESYDATGTVWDLVPGTRSSMYEHQREGFEFIWKNLAGGIIIEELEMPLSSSGSGCIISHAPGTGKTRLTIVFLQSYMKLYPDSRPVIIAPKSMLLTWEEEFKKWNINIPFHNMNNLEFSGQENQAAISISKQIRGSGNNEDVRRTGKLLSWKMNKSILGITYALFKKLVGAVTKNAGRTTLVELMGEALLKLPSLVVLDEGHTPRNDKSYIYKSLLNVETKRRIILSGTPFQNNFTELYNTMCLVNSNFDRTSSESDDKMKKKLRKMGKEIQSRGPGEKLRELKCMISPFVHVHKGNILQKSCPGLKDALILLQPTELQEELIGVLGTNEQKAGHLDLIHAISLVSVHPSLLPERYLQEHQFSSYRDRLEQVKRDPYAGAKTKFVMEICRLSEALNEKVLIYSQYIDPLTLIKKQLRAYFGWTEGIEVLYMDGCLDAKQRQKSINSLNDPRSKVRVLLASIKSCSEGIHLVGASRVVLMDVVWNPSIERQAISRAYRLGQKKIVYTYHLIAAEMELQKYKTQTVKDRLSEMLFSSTDMDSFKENMPDIVSEDQILQEMFQRNDKLGGLFKQIIYQPKESNLVD